MKVLILDNYDSFTYNLYQYVGEILQDQKKHFILETYRNDERSCEEIKKEAYTHIIVSPGAGVPNLKQYFGVCQEVIQKLAPTTPFLGVCLGMQGLATTFDGKLKCLEDPLHGKTSYVEHDLEGIFYGLPSPLSVMHYHSLIIDELPSCFTITSWLSSNEPKSSSQIKQDAHDLDTHNLDDKNKKNANKNKKNIMGIRHKQYPHIEGIQFHPESFATEGGQKILFNFLFQKHNHLSILKGMSKRT